MSWKVTYRLNLSVPSSPRQSFLVALARLALHGRLQPRPQRDLHVAVDADGGEEDPVQVGEGDGAVRHLVDEVAEGVLVQVQQHPDDGAPLDAAVRAVGVLVAVDEPAALVVDVHAPRFVVFACNTETVSGNGKLILQHRDSVGEC